MAAGRDAGFNSHPQVKAFYVFNTTLGNKEGKVSFRLDSLLSRLLQSCYACPRVSSIAKWIYSRISSDCYYHLSLVPHTGYSAPSPSLPMFLAPITAVAWHCVTYHTEIIQRCSTSIPVFLHYHVCVRE